MGLLVVRALQAYRQAAGKPFDDENDDAYWRLQVRSVWMCEDCTLCHPERR